MTLRNPGKILRWLLPAVLVAQVVFLIAPSLDRLFFLARPPTAEPLLSPTDAAFLTHPFLGVLHIISGLLMILLGPWQFVRSVRLRWPGFHRWAGGAFVISSLSVAVTGIVMNAVFPPVGGVPKLAVIYVMSVGLVIALVAALRAIVRRDVLTHRAWMMRAFAIALSAGTTAFVMLPYFLVYGPPSDLAVGVSRWAGLLITMTFVEVAVLGGAGSLRVSPAPGTREPA